MEYDRRFLKGINEFDRGLFYRAHETLEELWLEDRGSERGFYQGLIQMAAAYFKWEQEVPRGALKLLRSAIRKLELYRPLCLGVNVTKLLECVEVDLAVVEAWCGRGGGPPELRPPQLSPEGVSTPDSRTSLG